MRKNRRGPVFETRCSKIFPVLRNAGNLALQSLINVSAFAVTRAQEPLSSVVDLKSSPDELIVGNIPSHVAKTNIAIETFQKCPRAHLCGTRPDQFMMTRKSLILFSEHNLTFAIW